MSDPTIDETEKKTPAPSETEAEKTENAPPDTDVKVQPRAGGHQVGLCLEVEP
ncbi:hypothetical protein OV079_49100 [Nannocystis pusilla]|uniref:Uncharacterized protein n=1 Tax=Nannocystis pusilla TaxID=889268 RepID=A0A9X3F2C7_9BACT|nr:hypothetical protein [Nannocystis pusilla]MCY1013359.1 hypothetical protein [Nannocystis pusilla]